MFEDFWIASAVELFKRDITRDEPTLDLIHALGHSRIINTCYFHCFVPMTLIVPTDLLLIVVDVLTESNVVKL